jgi:hypothetical protein
VGGGVGESSCIQFYGFDGGGKHGVIVFFRGKISFFLFLLCWLGSTSLISRF